MERVVLEILDSLRSGEVDAQQLDRIIRERSAQAHDGRRTFAKKHVLPYYLRVRDEAGEQWRSWDVDGELDERFIRTLQMKPRRSASGVATITVITKPWPCANSCVYCPDNARMPKSYLPDEPACQRAERSGFSPYLQVASRLRTLVQMGHATDKVELIVLGGTWLDYPAPYRLWFISELFRALNEGGAGTALPECGQDARLAVSEEDPSWSNLVMLHKANESAAHRVVGLVVETRPDTITPDALLEMRRLGCTKVQLGVQSIDEHLLRINGRAETPDTIRRALDLCRLFGFKTHTHFMLNLLGATPESDIRDYRLFASDAAYSPDEVKLYPCALVAGTELVAHYESGRWRPYGEEELIGVLRSCVLATPAFTRISRMIRDISADDILVGNKKANLRQMVDESLGDSASEVREIRFREIGTGEVSFEGLRIDDIPYSTHATDERFLQWVTPDGKIIGFLRLSLPRNEAWRMYGRLPTKPGEAMIREVHVYGFATAVGAKGASAQHRGFGKALIERACEIAREAGFSHLNVISAIGTREYYRNLGFEDAGLYQKRAL